MSYESFELADRIAALVDRVVVTDGGLKAETAGETYEGESPQALAGKLSPILYQTLHSGRDKPFDVSMRTFRDRSFEEALYEATGRLTTTTPGRVVGTGDGYTIVELDGLRVQVPDDRIAERSDGVAHVVLPGTRPGLSPGFFFASASKAPGPSGGPTLRLYARLDDPEAAPPVWRALVTFLEDAGVPWRAKISSSRALYPRNDAVVVYLPRPGWRAARACAEALQATGLLGEGVSPFTHPITGSVSCAFEPDDPRPFCQEMSFGQHRAQVFTEALVRHAALPLGEQEPVTEIIAASFVDAGIDPSEPARNLSSPVIDVLRTY